MSTPKRIPKDEQTNLELPFMSDRDSISSRADRDNISTKPLIGSLSPQLRKHRRWKDERHLKDRHLEDRRHLDLVSDAIPDHRCRHAEPRGVPLVAGR